MISRAYKPTIVEDNAPEVAGNDCHGVLSISNTGISKVFSVNPDALNDIPLFRGILFELQNDYGFWRWLFCFVRAEYICLRNM